MLIKFDHYPKNAYPIFESKAGELIVTIPHSNICCVFRPAGEPVEELLSNMLSVIDEAEGRIRLQKTTMPYQIHSYSLFNSLGTWIGEIINDRLHCVIDVVKNHQEMFLGEMIH